MASPTAVAFAAGVGSVAGAVLGALIAENLEARMTAQAKGGTVLLASAVGAGIGGYLAAPAAASSSTTAAGMGKPPARARGLSQLSPR